jgi:uncharacterized protein (DUF2164 family)
LWLIEDRNIILQEIVANFTINKEIKETTINYITQRFGNFFMQLGINNKTRLEGEKLQGILKILYKKYINFRNNTRIQQLLYNFHIL